MRRVYVVRSICVSVLARSLKLFTVRLIFHVDSIALGHEPSYNSKHSHSRRPTAAALMDGFRRAGYVEPSVIQAQAWPNVLKGRDCVGVAKTGSGSDSARDCLACIPYFTLASLHSLQYRRTHDPPFPPPHTPPSTLHSGKTLGFLVPCFLQITQGARADLRAGPTALVLAPTRELACQIREEVVKFGTSLGIWSTCVYGGAPKGPQIRDLRDGKHIVIATPGRLNDFLESGVISLRQCSYLVFDEADRMLDMGFEPQIRKIVASIPRERQTLFFTATWPREVRRLASEFLNSPVVIYIGDTENLQANPDVTQIVHVVDDMRQKERLLQDALSRLGRGELCIVFCGTKRMCDQLERGLGRYQRAAALHGDKDQQNRTRTLNDFKNGSVPIMIATDVAARGVDVKNVTYVVNYDFPQSVEDYVHRIGRTGRAGAKGTAITFITSKDSRKAPQLIKIMEGAGQTVSDDLRSVGLVVYS